MRKKLDTRFPASRIKKIMQTDEDVGKIALVVPLLVSKALELFLQDLCHRTYDVTLKRGAKTISSSHLKHCVHNFSVFDFLKETVSRVIDVTCSDVGGEERSSKRRKSVDGEGNVTDEEFRRSKAETVHNSRGRGRGRRRGTDLDSEHYNKCEEDPDMSLQRHDKLEHGAASTGVPVRDFDLNLDLDENGFTAEAPFSALPAASTIITHEMKREESWPLFTCIDKMTIDPVHLALMDKRFDEEEDYDNED